MQSDTFFVFSNGLHDYNLVLRIYLVGVVDGVVDGVVSDVNDLVQKNATCHLVNSPYKILQGNRTCNYHRWKTVKL